MSLDFVALTAANARSFEQALAVYSGEESATPGGSGELHAFAKEVYDAYGDDYWPFAGDPIVEDGFVLLTVAPEAWESEVPSLVERAHRRGLVALDPQWSGEGKLFAQGEQYA